MSRPEASFTSRRDLTLWKAWPRQARAVEHLAQARAAWWREVCVRWQPGACLPCPVYKLLSQEAGRTSREYVVTTLPAIQAKVKAAGPGALHLYEIIAPDTPVHLFLDVEFYKQWNPGQSGHAQLQCLKRQLTAWLSRVFGVPVVPSCVVDLDSSTATKCSRHLIVRMPQRYMFRSVAHAGEVMLAFAQAMRIAAGEGDPDAAVLWAAQEDGPRQFIVDMAVYTKNRAMRMYLANKRGKQACLLPAVDCTFSVPEPIVAALQTAPSAAEFSIIPVDDAGVEKRLVGPAAWENEIIAAAWITQSLPPMHEALHAMAGLGLELNQQGAAAVEYITSTHPCAPDCPLLYAWLPDAVSVVPAAPWQVAGCPPALCLPTHARCTMGQPGHRFFSRWHALEHGDDPAASSAGREVVAAPNASLRAGPSQQAARAGSAPGWCIACHDIQGVDIAACPCSAALDWVLALAAAHGGPAPGIRQWTLHVRMLGFKVPAEHAAAALRPRVPGLPEPVLLPGGESGCSLVAYPVLTSLLVDIAHNRFCARIGRPHASNHVRYNVSVPAGLAKQTCLDPACAGWQSQPTRAPPDVLPDMQGPTHGTLLLADPRT